MPLVLAPQSAPTKRRPDDVRLHWVPVHRLAAATLSTSPSGERGSLAIRELPAAERPRERLRSHGAHAPSPGELLAIWLGSGPEGRSGRAMGRQFCPGCAVSCGLLPPPPGP